MLVVIDLDTLFAILRASPPGIRHRECLLRAARMHFSPVTGKER